MFYRFLESLCLLCGCFSLEYPLPPFPSVSLPPGPFSNAASCMKPSWVSFPTPAGNGLSPGAVGWAVGGKHQSWSAQECWGLWDLLTLDWTRWESSRAFFFFFFRFALGCRHSRKFRVNKQQSNPELSLDWSEEAKCQLQFKNELGKNNQVTHSSHHGGF